MSSAIVKCVVWDLDQTVWNGVLLEGDPLSLRPGVRELIVALDARGILQSIASRNEPGPAWLQLRRFGLEHFFLHPQINWEAKSQSIARIAAQLNLGIDSFAFIDDQAFERDEVHFAHPTVRLYDAAEIPMLLSRPELSPRVVTADARRRREMYQADQVRTQEEKAFHGPNEAYLRTLEMVLTVQPATAEDLPRVEELVARTNQLNTTGQVYGLAELDAFRRAEDHRLLVAEFADKHGSYGKIGVVLLQTTDTVWTIKLLLMSCRVMNRGVGGAIITLLRHDARNAGVRLCADFRATDRNRMMYVTYKFAGFSEIAEADGLALLESDLTQIPELPDYLKVIGCGEGALHA